MIGRSCLSLLVFRDGVKEGSLPYKVQGRSPMDKGETLVCSRGYWQGYKEKKEEGKIRM